jgi:hypothetical protein
LGFAGFLPRAIDVGFRLREQHIEISGPQPQGHLLPGPVQRGFGAFDLRVGLLHVGEFARAEHGLAQTERVITVVITLLAFAAPLFCSIELRLRMADSEIAGNPSAALCGKARQIVGPRGKRQEDDNAAWRQNSSANNIHSSFIATATCSEVGVSGKHVFIYILHKLTGRQHAWRAAKQPRPTPCRQTGHGVRMGFCTLRRALQTQFNRCFPTARR